MENLAWQIIHRISTVHTAGRQFVVGTLWKVRTPILVDALGQLYFFEFKNTVEFRAAALPFYPPEYHPYLRLAHLDPNHMERPFITKEFDIFQLGQLLWILVESWTSGQSAKKLKGTFYTSFRDRQSRIHSHATAFPRLSENVPEYLRHMVGECCAGSPSARPRAVELLSRFPCAHFNMIPGMQEDSAPQAMDISAFQKSRVRSVFCDYCGAVITSIAYYCSLCVGGDYDVCQQCFDDGKHCNDRSHFLIEIPVSITCSDVTRFHSSADSSGKRRITNL